MAQSLTKMQFLKVQLVFDKLFADKFYMQFKRHNYYSTDTPPFLCWPFIVYPVTLFKVIRYVIQILVRSLKSIFLSIVSNIIIEKKLTQVAQKGMCKDSVAEGQSQESARHHLRRESCRIRISIIIVESFYLCYFSCFYQV